MRLHKEDLRTLGAIIYDAAAFIVEGNAPHAGRIDEALAEIEISALPPELERTAKPEAPNDQVNDQINDGRIIDAVIEKPEAPAPARSGILTGEAYWKNLAENLLRREAELDTRVEELEAQLADAARVERDRIVSLIDNSKTFYLADKYGVYAEKKIRAALAPGEGREDV